MRVTIPPKRDVPMAADIAVTNTSRSRLTGTNRSDVAPSTRPATISGWRFQSSCAIGPPIE